jgi:hypothetical protein
VSDSGRPAAGTAALLCAAALLLAAQILPADAATGFDESAPYVIITTKGYRIDAMEKPGKEGEMIKVRLSPTGQLAIVPAASIDWAATERYNAPRPTVEKKREPVSTADGAHSIASAAGAAHAEPIEMTIIGRKSGRAAVAAEEPGDASGGMGSGAAGEGSSAGEAGAGGDADAAPAKAADPAAVAAQLRELVKQLGQVRESYDGSMKLKGELESRLAELQAKVANEPQASSVQSYESPSRKALAQVQAQLDAVSSQIPSLEQRMNDIRNRAVELGGSVD